MQAAPAAARRPDRDVHEARADLALGRSRVMAYQRIDDGVGSSGPQSGANDFDFLLGQWRVHHRRLKRRLQSCNDWEAFEGTSHMSQLMACQCNVDDNVLELPAGTYRAVSLRAFDPQTRQWAIWWLDGRNPGQLDAPVRGSFTDGVGIFDAEDCLEGRPIRVRFTWSHITAISARWQQAFSADGGATWETNWTMEFERAPKMVSASPQAQTWMEPGS